MVDPMVTATETRSVRIEWDNHVGTQKRYPSMPHSPLKQHSALLSGGPVKHTEVDNARSFSRMIHAMDWTISCGATVSALLATTSPSAQSLGHPWSHWRQS
jgi:hypothetical protein